MRAGPVVDAVGSRRADCGSDSVFMVDSLVFKRIRLAGIDRPAELGGGSVPARTLTASPKRLAKITKSSNRISAAR